MMITDWSLYIETMGVGQRAAICQIGLVSFNRDSGQRYTESLFDVDLEDSIRLGVEIHTNTVHWWATQKNGFSYSNKEEVYFIKLALEYLLTNIILKASPVSIPIWAKGPTFDLSIIEFYCNRLNMPIPWKYNVPRDLRTLQDAYEFAGLTLPARKEITHNALQDAIDQADMICRLLKR